jgi:hypothetical protein
LVFDSSVFFSVSAMPMPSSTTLVSQAMVWRQTWRSFGGCINGDGVFIDLLSLQGNSGGRVSFLARLAVHLPVCSGWCIQIPLVGLLFVVWGWTVRQLASNPGNDEEMAACLWPVRSTNQQHALGMFFVGSLNFDNDSSSIQNSAMSFIPCLLHCGR